MELPRINQKVEFKLLHGPYAAAYSTYVEDVGETGIVVAHPLLGGTPIPLAQGDEARLEFSVKDSARVSFASSVSGLDVRVVPVVVLSLPDPGQIERHQQRGFVRLEAALDLDYAVTGGPVDPNERGNKRHARTRDISGSGVLVSSAKPYPEGTRLEISLNLGEQVVRTAGEVVRQVAQDDPKEFWLGLRFTELEERDRDRIVRYIFNEQRERRRRGLL